MAEHLFIGIDGCRNGWIYAAIGSQTAYRIGFAADILRLWKKIGEAVLTLIDIPIGLPYEGPRACDVEARKLLRPKSGSCVFPPPCREALQAASYEEACALNQQKIGARISRQAWGIAQKIREVDDFLRSTPAARGRLREAHPEVCFALLAGQPVVSSKKTAAGMAERVDLLRRHLADTDAFVLHAFTALRRHGAVMDDILDALALAVAARYAGKNPLTLPPRPARDREGLPMEIVYFERPE